MAPHDADAAKSTPPSVDGESARNDATATYNPAALNYNPTAVSYNPSAVSYNPSAVSYIPPSMKTASTESPSFSAHVAARASDPIFTTTTIAPSPPGTSPSSRTNTMLAPLDTAQHDGAAAYASFIHSATPVPTPISASGLKIRTDVDNMRGPSTTSVRSLSRPSSGGSDTSLSASDDKYHHGHGHGALGSSQAINIKRTPSIKQVLAEGSLSRSLSASSPNSLLSSPQLSALPDITPLPSPIVGKGEHNGGQSPGMWNAQRRGSRRVSRPRSIEFGDKIEEHPSPSSHSGAGELHTQIVNQKRRQQYAGLSLTSENGGSGAGNGGGHHGPTGGAHKEHGANYAKGHGRDRSQSDYYPPPITVAKPRNQTVSGTHEADPLILEEVAGNMGGLAPPRPAIGGKTESYMRREPHLAAMRGIGVVVKPPTPPSSRASRKEDGSDSDSSLPSRSFSKRRGRERGHTYFDACTFPDNKRRRWRALKPLGEGTFSKVILATSQLDNEEDTIDENLATSSISVRSMRQEPEVDSKKLVAIKICEHGPKGGASEERILLQLKRELELMKDLHHPSLIDLRAFHMEETRMILVLGYCAGGDLFDIASEHPELLKAPLIKRIFSEQVMAVKYLHEHGIVHRDVKLENVLVNLPPSDLANATIDWSIYPYSITTLTDLGLARKVTPGEKLSTRCGSDDYAAPEVIMGQPYDGMEVDAWSLGVLLYTLLELRLPFDPLPGAAGEVNRQRSRTSHRIARVEWRWVKWSGEDGNHDGDYVAMEKDGVLDLCKAVEGLLRRARSRWTIDKLSELEWVKESVKVEGGIRFREEEKAVEVEKLVEEEETEDAVMVNGMVVA